MTLRMKRRCRKGIAYVLVAIMALSICAVCASNTCEASTAYKDKFSISESKNVGGYKVKLTTYFSTQSFKGDPFLRIEKESYTITKKDKKTKDKLKSATIDFGSDGKTIYKKNGKWKVYKSYEKQVRSWYPDVSKNTSGSLTPGAFRYSDTFVGNVSSHMYIKYIPAGKKKEKTVVIDIIPSANDVIK